MECMDTSKGVYLVGTRTWEVGDRYQILSRLGSGSYGDVCRALDLELHQVVAIKRVEDVFSCAQMAKQELREVCILQHLAHPNVISFKEVFSVHTMGRTDLYMVTEFAEGGDLADRLANQVEPMPASTVQSIIKGVLQAVQYLHSCNVWHRDIKAENLLLKEGRVVLCDFGLSRAAAAQGEATFEPPCPCIRSPKEMDSGKRHYTKTVVTPTHRAPEVIMSEGEYTSAIDIWSVGCIFGELLLSQVWGRSQSLFRGHEPATPHEGELFTDEDCDSERHQQLEFIFDIIGTPSWRDVSMLPSTSWREYLKKLPGRAGRLAPSLIGQVDTDAIDLLLRMLCFDSANRCTAEEALAHRYFQTSIQAPPQDIGSCFTHTTNIMLDIARFEKEMNVLLYPQVSSGCKEKLEALLAKQVEQCVIRRAYVTPGSIEEEGLVCGAHPRLLRIRHGSSICTRVLPVPMPKLHETRADDSRFPMIKKRVAGMKLRHQPKRMRVKHPERHG